MAWRNSAAVAAASLVVVTTVGAQNPRSGLSLKAPITRWDEAIPVGNGMLGGLLWGGDSTLILSLDRGDLWDERTPEIFAGPEWTWKGMQALVKAGNMKRFHELFDDPYDQLPYPTKLPAGRVELTWHGHVVDRFELNLELAEAWAIDGDDTLKVAALADEEMIAIVAPGEVTAVLVPPAGVDRLWYPPAQKESRGAVGGWVGEYFRQATESGSFRVVAERVLVRDSSFLGAGVLEKEFTPRPLEDSVYSVGALARSGWSSYCEKHHAWWRDFWSKSSVSLPDSALQLQYDLAKYFYGSAARLGAPPMPLQGVWTADNNGLPPWKGDYHNDLNTQMTYLAAHAAGLDEAVDGWLTFLEDRLPVFREFAHNFYGVDGAVIPGVMTLSGKPMGGWGMYSLSPTNGAWVAFSYWKQWRLNRNPTFLRERSYPFVSEIGTALAALLVEGKDGRLVLPLSSSPEIHDNSIDAFLTPNSNYDQALLIWCFGALAEMSRELGYVEEADRWAALRDGLGGLQVDATTNALKFSSDEAFSESHRHFSHAMSIYPLGLLAQADSTVINATLDQIIEHGTSQWVGYSFAWFAAMLAHTGRGDDAYRYLTDYLSFTSRNGFHLNGDQSGRGLSDLTYRPFTLEGNFMAMDAIQEMLVQSDGKTVKVFPAIPKKWRNLSFTNLRADGGFTVSAKMSDGKIVFVEVVDRDGKMVERR